MTKIAVKFYELLEGGGTIDTETERDPAAAKIMEGWEQLVKATASKVIGKKSTFRNRAVKRWNEEKESGREWVEEYVLFIASKTTVGGEEYAKAQKEVKETGERNRREYSRM